jgi:hypothetical protein
MRYLFNKTGDENEMFTCRESLTRYINMNGTAAGRITVGCGELERIITPEETTALLRLFLIFSHGNASILEASNKWGVYEHDGWFINYDNKTNKVKAGSFYSFFFYLLYNKPTFRYLMKLIEDNPDVYRINTYKVGMELIHLILFENSLASVSINDRIYMAYYTYSLAVKGFSGYIYNSEDNTCSGFSYIGRDRLLTDVFRYAQSLEDISGFFIKCKVKDMDTTKLFEPLKALINSVCKSGSDIDNYLG